MKHFDYIVVGSGCAGAMAAETLAEAGVEVAVLDVGKTNKEYARTVPNQDFLTLRRNDDEQSKYFIGKDGEGIDLGDVGKGAQVTPTRQHMVTEVEKYIPLKSESFSPLESLGYGGLGIGWGLQCWEYSDADLTRAGLPIQDIRSAYETVAQRIGVSGTRDDAAKYTLNTLKNFQPSPKMDRNHQIIYKNYQKKKQTMRAEGIYIGRTPLALITKDSGLRKAYAYRDMDFYDDNDHSTWRPWMTIDTLRKKTKITYIGNQLVLSFSEKKSIITVQCLDISTGQKTHFMCNKLVLASSALGTARIVLRSCGKPGDRLPLLSNPHSYIPYLQPSMIGKGPEKKKLGFGELSYFIDEDGDDAGISVASSYGYQSLMLFRIVAQSPLDFSTSRRLMQYISSGFVIMIAQHPDAQSDEKYLELRSDKKSPTGDRLFAHYALTTAEEKEWDKREKQYVSAMRKLHAYAIKRVKTEHGSGIHYAGTVPFSHDDQPLTLSHDGRLHGTKNVYVADSSGFTYLPAKGLTFTLMANAHRVTKNALKNEQ